MARGKTLQTSIPGFGRIYQPTYRDKKSGELKHSAVFWMAYRTSTGEVYRSTRQRDQKAAYAELLQQAGRMGKGEIADAAPERVTFGTLFDMMLEQAADANIPSEAGTRRRIEKHLRPVFGDIRVLALRKSDVEKFKSRQIKSGLSPATVNRCLSNLRRALQIGADEDPPLVTRAIPKWFGKLDESEGQRSGIVTPEMYARLKDAFRAPHALLALVIGYHTGLRKGAILRLRWEWIDFAAGLIRIPRKESNATKLKPKQVPIYGDMRKYLELAALTNPPGCQWVVQECGRPVDSVKTAWAGAFERAGLMVERHRKDGTPIMKPAAIFHDLRRTAATMLHQAGFSVETIMDICGWKTPDMPKRYIQQTDTHTQEVGRKMEEFMQKQRATVAAKKDEAIQ